MSRAAEPGLRVSSHLNAFCVKLLYPTEDGRKEESLMFTEIRAKNFKSWADLELPLGKVTGLFGANSSGKTSVLQVLLLLKQTLESEDPSVPLDLGDERSPVRLGSFRGILRDHDAANELSLGVTWDQLPFDINVRENGGFMEETQARRRRVAGFSDYTSRAFYLGPLREEPRREYVWTGGRPSDVGYKGVGAVPALLAAQLAEGSTVEERVAAWLSHLGLVDSFRVAPVAEGVDIYRVYVKRFGSSAEVLLTDLGFGVSQVLPVLVLLAYVPEGSTVIMEQPEIHLHPSVQAALADVILEASRERDLQVIVESHSEHLLRRIQLRIAEEQLDDGTPVSADDVRLWFIDQEDAESRATDLKLCVPAAANPAGAEPALGRGGFDPAKQVDPLDVPLRARHAA